MILDCQCGEKKFVVPDNAIPAAGRLVQCSFCGNKWTQFPITKKVNKEPINFSSKNEVIEKPAKVPPKIKKENALSMPAKKKKIVKRKNGPSIYSKEYLEKKHGISIDENYRNTSKDKSNKIVSKSYFGFYSYLIVLLFFVSSIIGILNLTKEVIIFYLPFTEIYIEYLFENLDYFGILLRDAFNIY